LWDVERRVLIIQDAVLWRGVPDREGQVPSPPPYYTVARYIDSIKQLQALQPDWLMTAHYPIVRGADAADFFATSLAFVERVDEAVRDVMSKAHNPLTLNCVIDAVDKRLGPFETRIQWVGPVLAHLSQQVEQGQLCAQQSEQGRVWVSA